MSPQDRYDIDRAVPLTRWLGNFVSAAAVMPKQPDYRKVGMLRELL